MRDDKTIIAIHSGAISRAHVADALSALVLNNTMVKVMGSISVSTFLEKQKKVLAMMV